MAELPPRMDHRFVAEKQDEQPKRTVPETAGTATRKVGMGTPIARTALRPRSVQAAPAGSELKTRLRRAWGRHPLVAFAGHRSRITFYRQLHALVKSGQGIPTSLVKLAAYAPDRRTREAMKEMQRDISLGATFGESMRKHADRFDDAIVELILFAEETGNLQKVLEQVIANQEEVQSLRWRALFASLWPFYLLFAAVFVGPLFGLARNAGSIGGNWVGAYFSGLVSNLFFGGIAIAAVLGGPFAIAALGLDSAWERFVLAIPFAGRVKRDFIGSRFFLALGLGLGAGVEVKRAVKIALSASGSPSMSAQASATVARIESGSTLADALAPLHVFDRPSLGALAIGEDTGTLDEQLKRVAQDAQEAALRGAKLVMIAVLVVVVLVLLATIVSSLLGTLFGPISDYYNLPNSIE